MSCSNLGELRTECYGLFEDRSNGINSRQVHIWEGLAENSHTNPPLLGSQDIRVMEFCVKNFRIQGLVSCSNLGELKTEFADL